MSKPSFALVQRIVHELIQPFYGIERATPLPKQLGGRHENDAEHSWGLALFASALAPHLDENLDIGLVCQFAVVHDLVEVYAGDTPNLASEEEKAGKEERERVALEKLMQEFRELPWITETVAEYEKQTSKEAQFVRSLDKTLALLQEYESEGQILRDFKVTIDQLAPILRYHKRKAMIHEGAFEYYLAAERLLLDNPHFFHQSDK